MRGGQSWGLTMQSIISNEKRCYLTGSKFKLEKHHCMNGAAYRKKAEHDGLWVWLNADVHRAVHSNRPDWKRELKRIAQEAYERTHTREEWMHRYHKNYLE